MIAPPAEKRIQQQVALVVAQDRVRDLLLVKSLPEHFGILLVAPTQPVEVDPSVVEFLSGADRFDIPRSRVVEAAAVLQPLWIRESNLREHVIQVLPACDVSNVHRAGLRALGRLPVSEEFAVLRGDVPVDCRRAVRTHRIRVEQDLVLSIQAGTHVHDGLVLIVRTTRVEISPASFGRRGDESRREDLGHANSDPLASRQRIEIGSGVRRLVADPFRRFGRLRFLEPPIRILDRDAVDLLLDHAHLCCRGRTECRVTAGERPNPCCGTCRERQNPRAHAPIVAPPNDHGPRLRASAHSIRLQRAPPGPRRRLRGGAPLGRDT